MRKSERKKLKEGVGEKMKVDNRMKKGDMKIRSWIEYNITVKTLIVSGLFCLEEKERQESIKSNETLTALSEEKQEEFEWWSLKTNQSV